MVKYFFLLFLMEIRGDEDKQWIRYRTSPLFFLLFFMKIRGDEDKKCDFISPNKLSVRIPLLLLFISLASLSF